MKTNYRSALVTGGAGFIGSLLSKRLLEKGIRVTILDDLSTGNQKNVPLGAKFIKGSVLDSHLLRDIIDNIDVVFHLAAIVSIRLSIKNFYEDAQTNLMGTVNLLNCLKNTEVNKVIYASSMAVYANTQNPIPIDEEYIREPISPYGISKLTSEKYCLVIGEALKIKTIILRYFNTYGPGQAFTPYVGVINIFTNRLLNGQPPIIYGSGEQRRDFVHVSDVVDATLNAADYTGKSDIFNIATGIATSVNEIAFLLCNKINPKINPIYTEEQEGELKNSIACISKARNLLGYKPQRRIEDKIDQVIDWNKKNPIK